MNQAEAPYFEALQAYLRERNLGFHIPGHQQATSLPSEFAQLLASWGCAADITEVLGIDDIHAPHDQCLRAQQLAATAFGADHSYFLVNGSTVGNQAMFLATLGPQDTVLLPYASHRSAYAALMLCGAKAQFFSTSFDETLLCCLPPTVGEVEAAMDCHPETKAVFLTSPIYHGACADVKAIAALVHARGKLLLVDEAWGAHLNFSPGSPDSAVATGADLVVQSLHKMSSGLSQTAILHLCGSAVDKGRLETVLRHLQTSSPSSLLLASADCARRQMALHGEALWAQTLDLAEGLSESINKLPGLLCSGPGRALWDGSRLSIAATERGYRGHELALYLRNSCQIQVEMSEAHQILVVLSPGHTLHHCEELLRALDGLPRKKPVDLRESRELCRNLVAGLEPKKASQLTIRQAFQSRTERVKLEDSVGRSSAELLYCYPPGLPFLYPGQEIAPLALEHIRHQERLGGSVQGGSDPSLKTLLVVKS